jgi:peptide/nickel transport system permease protein
VKKTERIFLVLFLGILGLILISPLTFRSEHLSKTQLSQSFCRPIQCGLFGKGENGIDLFSNTLKASQMAILLSLMVCLTTLGMGTLIGLVSALKPGGVDECIILATNLFLSFPGLLIAIALSSFVGQGLFSTWLILIIPGWAPFCRLSRSSALQVRSEEFILASSSVGCSSLRIALIHILPNIAPILIVHAAFTMAGVITVESTLSFLGLGISNEFPSLGRLVYTGKHYLIQHPHTALIPGAFVVLMIIGFYITGMILNRNLVQREGPA